MPGTFSQLYIQYIFAVRGRQNFILPSFEEELYKYIAGIIKAKEQKPLAVNGMPDHIHVLVGLKPAMRISDLIRDIKNNSTNFINDRNWLKQKFCWQEGYGVFSYSHSAFGNVIEYIKNQKMHHQKRTFQDEYLEFLQKFEIPFEEQYLFDFYG
jgi:putative transposase